MKKENNALAAPCGICCGICPVYKARENPQLVERLISMGIKKESLPCPGCREAKGFCPVIGSQCETYICVNSYNVEFCFQCPDFPCQKLNPSADRANVLPHNTKVFNLCLIREKGLEVFYREAQTIQDRYYKGKMEIGKGPRIP